MEKVFQCTSRKNKNGVEKVVGKMEIKNLSLTTAELFIYGDIVKDNWNKWSDEDTCPADITEFLKDLSSFENINVNINSGGGSVHGGLAIYNQLKRHNGYKTVRIDGIAASISSVIACSGDKVIIPTPSQFMIHKPSICLWASLNADELQSYANSLNVCEESILDVYMSKTKEGITRDQIKKLVDAETWFTGNTITDYFDFEVEEVSEAVASTSMFYEMYNRTPRGLRDKSFFHATKEPKLPQMTKEVKDLTQGILEKQKNWGIN